MGLFAWRTGTKFCLGEGHEERLNKGPLPKLYNLQLAVARVLMWISGKLEDQTDDSDFPHIFISSEEFCNRM